MLTKKNIVIYMLSLLINSCIAVNAAESVDLTAVEIGPISVPDGKAYTLEQVRKGVIFGAMQHKWQVESEMSGIVRIKIDGRKDGIVLVMDVLYDANKYSIKYVKSERLAQSRATIRGEVVRQHKSEFGTTYSRWMRNLTGAINRELIIMSM